MKSVLARTAAVTMVLVSVLAVAATAKPRRDTLFDPGSLYFASCEGVAYGTDDPDSMIASPGQSLTGLGGDDALTGAHGTQCLTGGAGNDTLGAGDTGTWIDGGPGNDRLTGGTAADSIKSGEGDDVIHGGPGDDLIDGDAGNDTINGDAGNDTISGGSGHNTIYGGAGNDLISSNDGSRELVDCGPGEDTVHADRSDRLRHCEHVLYRRNPYPVIRPRAGRSGGVFTIRYIAPYTTAIPDTDEGIAAFGEVVASKPSARCHPSLTLTSSKPMEPNAGSHVVETFVFRARGAVCRGTFRIAVTYRNSSFGVECDSIAGSQPRRRGAYGDCPYEDTFGFATLRIT